MGAALDEVDREILAAEQDAQLYDRRASNEVERVLSASSVSTSSSAASLHARPTAISRMSTQRDLERHPTELDRIYTARSQHDATVGVSMGRSNTQTRDSRKPMPPMGGGKDLPPKLDVDDYVVEFDGPNDPMHAQNWPLRKKMLTAAMLGFTTLTSAFTSSIFSAGTTAIAAEFGVSSEVGILGVSFYVLGFAFGPTLWAPISELKGRRLPLVVSMFGFSIFTIAVAVAKDLQTVLIARFFAGFMGACPLAVVAAVFSDMFNNATRGIAITIFSMMVFTGPLLAPFIGGFIVESYLGWRWTMYITSFMGFLSFGLDLFFLEETYSPQILVAKAAELRRRTQNHFIHAKQEEIEVDFRELLENNLSRPMRLLFKEPIVLLLSIYMSFIYGILYLFLTAYPLVFQGIHHFSPGVSGLAFFGMIIGEIIAGLVVLAQQPWYQRKLAANNGIPIPEWRLPSIIAGGVAFAAGLFWFGWSGYRADIHWIVPTASGLLTGFGLMSIFLQSLNYLVDAYLMFAASAIAGNTFLRSLCGAGFPLFSTYMFNGMGIQWASTLLGCVGVVLAPIPVIFWIYGSRIRARSKIAPTFPPQAQQPLAVRSHDTHGEKQANDERGANTNALSSAVPKKDGDKATESV
ncbi:major facilitator superfamily domain-containing protein [Coniella lustricola]|uniref:Major facilitator superfamily domain-containing protein n=1 Tax=Coniella lustricola TaxID=2025994 RepID=A0A2T3ABL8_9PEZI|nr:major facilitator superfamily domain-containing protein [Coniella lustricola]